MKLAEITSFRLIFGHSVIQLTEGNPNSFNGTKTRRFPKGPYKYNCWKHLKSIKSFRESKPTCRKCTIKPDVAKDEIWRTRPNNAIKKRIR